MAGRRAGRNLHSCTPEQRNPLESASFSIEFYHRIYGLFKPERLVDKVYDYLHLYGFGVAAFRQLPLDLLLDHAK